MVVWLKGFPDDRQALLTAGVEQVLAAHGSPDLKNGEIVISGRPDDFTIELGRATYRGRVAVGRSFDSDLHQMLRRFGDWVVETYLAPPLQRRPVDLSRADVLAIFRSALPARSPAAH